MEALTVLLSLSTTQTRLLAMRGAHELVRASLPLPSQVRCRHGMPALLEGLALLFDARPRVVLSAGERDAAWGFRLTDWDGRPQSSAYYDVALVAARVRRPRPDRLRGGDSFADLHRLRRRAVGEGG
jgi:transposase-like protein